MKCLGLGVRFIINYIILNIHNHFIKYFIYFIDKKAKALVVKLFAFMILPYRTSIQVVYNIYLISCSLKILSFFKTQTSCLCNHAELYYATLMFSFLNSKRPENYQGIQNSQ